MIEISLSSEQASDYQVVIDDLKRKQVRLTETRKAIISYLIASKEHPSAEQIYQDLKPGLPNLSLATIYNNLKLLVEEGFITELKRSNDTTTYYDFMGHDHLNVICERCGKITDLMSQDMPNFEQEVQKQTGYKITRELLTIYGLCPNCQ